MGDNKAPAIAGGIVLFLLLPLIIVIALILGALSALGDQCVPTSGGSAPPFGYPTKDKHDVKQGWDDGDPGHRGIDYDVPAGTSVLAAADGEVISAAGDTIKIRHDEAVETWYRYFDSMTVHAGDRVKRGDEIGKSGKGDEDEPGATGDHLHFELRVKGDNGALEPRDPTDEVGDAPAEESGCGCGSGGPLVGSNNQQKAYNYFTANGYSPEQAAGIVGNMIHESSVEPARMQNTAPGTVTHASEAAGSSLGWGIVQWTPAGKMINPSLQSGADDAKVESLEFQLDFLRKQLDGDGPIPEGAAGTAVRAARTVEDAAVAFGQKFERFAGSEDLGNPRYAERKATAREVFTTFGNGAGGTGGGACGAGNGDIVQTALMLAWDTPGHNSTAKSAAKPEYQEAMPRYNGATDWTPYTDCGVFVATVMVMSGVDKDYVRRGTGSQREYVRNSSKYEVFENLNNVSQLQPGDIFVHGGHTFIYTGDYEGGDGKSYNAVSASLGDHPPQASRVYFGDSRGHYTVARIKK
jgi:hypothetical protein